MQTLQKNWEVTEELKFFSLFNFIFQRQINKNYAGEWSICQADDSHVPIVAEICKSVAKMIARW